jgi:hypothetical protein
MKEDGSKHLAALEQRIVTAILVQNTDMGDIKRQ